MVTAIRAPERGDLVWLSFDPQAGREQAGRRPALVLSPGRYNRASGLALVCPITSRAKGYPFEVPLPQASAVQGVVLVDHLRSVDWRARNAELAGSVPPTILQDIAMRLAPLLDF